MPCVPDQRILMSAITTCARAATGVFLTAALAAGAVLPATASPRPAAVDPTTMSAAASAAKAAAFTREQASQARARAEQATAQSKKLLDRTEHVLDNARERLTRLSTQVQQAAEHRLGSDTGLLEVAAGVTQVAAAGATTAAPVGEALALLAEAVAENQSEPPPTPDPRGAESVLRTARAKSILDHRAAAYKAASARDAVENAEAALAAARQDEQQATATAAAATEKADALAASLRIDKRLVRPGLGTVSSAYGVRTHPITGARKAHTGMDFQYADGLAYAAAEGTVAEVSVDPAYGNLLTIAHGHGVQSRYAHLAATLVEPGEHVTAGQVIGTIGSTGLSTGPHLHFEIQVNGRFQDPADWLGG
jgi:murein DD-endopeptidase MepM/ murein hydrolase activator NlpD